MVCNFPQKMKKFLCLFFAALLSASLLTGCCHGTCQKTATNCGYQTASPVKLDRILDAVQTLAPIVTETPLQECDALSETHHVYLKLENQQKIGSFKLRGAYYMMSKLTPEQRKKGVVTCSAGNHAQGVGFSADKFGIKAAIFLPASAPEKKINAVKAYKNAQVFLVDGSFDDASAAALEYQKREGAVYVPPFNDLDVIAGQGTIGWELCHQLPEADAIVVPIGGGGLISGIASAVKALKPSCKVIGVQSEAAASMVASLQNGSPVTLDTVNTIADGTAVKRPGDITFDICRTCVDEIVTVTEKDVAKAISTLKRSYDITAEGAGALAPAAVMSGKISGKGLKVVCIISGGNIDPQLLDKILQENP